MTKLILILLVGLAFEAGGVVLLKKGVAEIGNPRNTSLREVLGVIKRGVVNPKILAGVLCEAIFFGCLLVLMGKSDISFLWPMTALSFVFTTFSGIWFLHERVSTIRWFGVIFIVIGAAFISYSEHSKPKVAVPSESVPVKAE